MIDPTTGEQTEINERGPKVTPHEVELFVDKLLYLAKGASMCVFAGSLPRDVDTDIYAFLIRELRRMNVTTVIDTDGDPLRRAVRAEPDVISPNVLEAEELVGHEFNDDEDRTYAVKEMCELGAREAIMTMNDGCFARMHHRTRAHEPALYRVRRARRERSSRARPSAPATPSWPASSPPGISTAGRGSTGLRGRLRRGIDPASGRRSGRSGRVGRLLGEVDVERPSAAHNDALT